MGRRNQFTVLVVEDEADIRNLEVATLRDEGYDVISAENGEVALKRIDERPPDLILLDMNMPVMDGVRFADTLKTRRLMFPLIVISATQAAGTWAKKVGAVGFLKKPFDLVDFLAAVKAIRSRARKANATA
jgi:CheY-like chemotaxis protein